MPLDLPRLDNRTFEQLVGEARSRIPAIAPQWTDQNYHDPGVTIMELFAWLVETDLYRLDRTTEASYRAFLRLLGAAPQAAQVAETVIICQSDGSSSVFPGGSIVCGADETVCFQTAEKLNLSAARLLSVLTDSDGDVTTANNQFEQVYRPFGYEPQMETALYLGFDQPLANPENQLSLYIWAGDAEADRLVWKALHDEHEAVQADIRVSHASAADSSDYHQHYSVRTVWEYFADTGRWVSLEKVNDQTRALTLSGFVYFDAPTSPPHAQGGVDNSAFDDQYFIRCRLISGSYDCPPEIRHIALNAVRVQHAVIVNQSENLGTSTGWARQSFWLEQVPVVPGTTQIQIDGETWDEAAWWDQVGPHDTAYVMVPETGEVQFGDGRQGRVPPAGAEIKAITYRVGGGTVGNVLDGTLKTIVPAPDIEIRQPTTAVGGADAETLPSAQGRVVAALNHPRRAVTLSDFETLALETPGVPVQRAFALADHHPAFPCLPALGNVTVVIVPNCGAPKPSPSAAMCREVLCYLERRRLVTTTVHVVGPIYIEVTVHAQLYFENPDDSEVVLARAGKTLDAFFHPLNGGPDGGGWPVGRDVYRAEIMALLHDVPGVAYVEDLYLQADGCPPTGCDDLIICATGLIVSGDHQLNPSEGDSPKNDKEYCCE